MGHGNEGWAWTSHSEEKVWGQSQRGTTMTQQQCVDAVERGVLAV